MHLTIHAVFHRAGAKDTKGVFLFAKEEKSSGSHLHSTALVPVASVRQVQVSFLRGLNFLLAA